MAEINNPVNVSYNTDIIHVMKDILPRHVYAHQYEGVSFNSAQQIMIDGKSIAFDTNAMSNSVKEDDFVLITLDIQYLIDGADRPQYETARCLGRVKTASTGIGKSCLYIGKIPNVYANSFIGDSILRRVNVNKNTALVGSLDILGFKLGGFLDLNFAPLATVPTAIFYDDSNYPHSITSIRMASITLLRDSTIERDRADEFSKTNYYAYKFRIEDVDYQTQVKQVMVSLGVQRQSYANGNYNYRFNNSNAISIGNNLVSIYEIDPNKNISSADVTHVLVRMHSNDDNFLIASEEGLYVEFSASPNADFATNTFPSIKAIPSIYLTSSSIAKPTIKLDDAITTHDANNGLYRLYN